MPLSEFIPTIISMEVDNDNESESEYRIRYGTQVKYLTVEPGTLEDDQLSQPLEFLPPLHYEKDWIRAKVHRNLESGRIEAGFSKQSLKSVQNIWHDTRINVLELDRVEQLTGSTFQAKCRLDIPAVSSKSTTTFIAKIARFEWEIPRIEKETRAYELLQRKGATLAPRFLAHLHENGRVMGFLLEYVHGHAAELQDLRRCRTILQAFHDLGLLHGDVNRYNFLVNEDEVKVIDFEASSEDAGTGAYSAEIQHLEEKFHDTSGEGAGFIYRDSS